MLITNILCALLILVGIVYLFMCKYRKYDDYLKLFIEHNQNITVITSDTEILAINKAGLNFFGFATFSEFHQKHKFLSKLFSETESDTKYVEGIDWITKIDFKQHIKVEMFHDDFKQVFYMQVSKIKKNRYQVSFYNISRMVAEKDAMVDVAEKDELTQIYNRVKFNKAMSLALREAEVYQEDFTITLFDIDYFKQVNDKYGHNAGDRVLVQLSLLVKSQLRDKDIFARWGGEEFIILSQGSTQSEAFIVANRLRESIEAFPFDDIGTLTCSFGVSQYRDNDTASTLLARADEALYKAKENGRNNVSL